MANEGKLEFERLPIRVVLTRAIAFSPTIVTLEKATLVGNRLYLVLFLTDGDTSVSTLPGLVPPREDPMDSPEAPRTTM